MDTRQNMSTVKKINGVKFSCEANANIFKLILHYGYTVRRKSLDFSQKQLDNIIVSFYHENPDK